MTSASLSRRLALLATIASSVFLASCGGSGSGGGGTSNLRALNLSSDLPTLDVYVGGNKQFGAQATGVLSGYIAPDANTYAININTTGSSTSLFTGSYSLAKDAHYTAVVWGSQSSLRVATLPEDDDQSTIGSGNSRVRMYNATTETGSMDVYITSTDATLANTTPTQAAITSGTLGGFREIPSGTYRLRVTGAGSPNDVRLDIAAMTLTAGRSATLVLTAGASGVLVNGTLVAQQDVATALSNTKARVRVIASVDASGVVAANVGAVALAGSGLTSPALGVYTLIDAGTVSTTLRINGAIAISGPLTYAAGTDYTLLAYGSAGAGQLKVITDDNRLPLSTTGTKIRVVNGVASLDALTLLVDYGQIAESANVAAGTASAYAQVASNTGAQIEVDSPSLGQVYLTSRTGGDILVSQGVYTVFILSGKVKADGTVAPTGTLRRERP